MSSSLSISNLDADKHSVLSAVDVSRETADRLTVLVEELCRWQSVKNLVGPSTLNSIWTRHIADSLQLFQQASTVKNWVDIGSGAGFPGLVIGILLRERGNGHVDLVESNGRKCAFLRHIIRLTGAHAKVHEGRIEKILPLLAQTNVEAITARALASLPELLDMSKDVLSNGAIGIFPKGQDWENELIEARKQWDIEVEPVQSQIDARGRILIIRNLQKIGGAHG